MKKYWYVLALTLLLFNSTTYVTAQAYVPVPVTGFNQDVIAESTTDAFAVTTAWLDDQFKIVYTKAFAAANVMLDGSGNALPYKGGLPDNRILGGGTYQLAPYNGNNVLFLSNTAQTGTIAAGTLTFTTPAAYGKLKILGFSTQGHSIVAVVLHFTDNTQLTVPNITFLDWFYQTANPIVIRGFGRFARPSVSTPGGQGAPPTVPAGSYVVDGITTPDTSGSEPRFYEFPITIPCTSLGKLVKSVDFTYTPTGNEGATSRAAILAVAGQPYVPPTVTLTSTPDGCNNTPPGSHSGTATVTIVNGGSAGFTLNKWFTSPQQVGATAGGLAPGRDSAQLIDATGTCRITTAAVIVDSGVMPKPVVASVDTCVGFNVTLSVKTPGTDTTYNWYTVATGGTPVKTGNTYTVPTNTTATYYIEGTITNIPPGPNACITLPRTVATVTFEPLLATPSVSVGATSPTSVTFHWAPVANATSYKVSVNGGTYQATGNGGTDTSYTVTGTTGANITITVIAYGKLPCQTSAAGSATFVIPSNGVFVPKAFTPNGDGLNDVLYVYGNFIQQLDMKIFNQWGQAIFETANKGNGWDGTYKGKMQPSGVYMYALKATLQDGTVVNTKGSINLIR